MQILMDLPLLSDSGVIGEHEREKNRSRHPFLSRFPQLSWLEK